MNLPFRSTHVDENGYVIGVFRDGDLGVYQHNDGMSETMLDVCQAIGNTSCGGTRVGRTLSWNSFSKGNKVILDRPGHGSSIVDRYYVRARRAGLYGYFKNAGQKEDFDISWHTNEGGYVSGTNGLIISSRDAGNILAGLMSRAARGAATPLILAAYGQYNLEGVGKREAVARSALTLGLPSVLGKALRAYMFLQEDPVTIRAILYGLHNYNRFEN